MVEERVVVVEELAEAEAGVEGDLIEGDSGACRGGEAFVEVGEDEGEDLVGGEGGESAPVGGAAAGMHEDDAAAPGWRMVEDMAGSQRDGR